MPGKKTNWSLEAEVWLELGEKLSDISLSWSSVMFHRMAAAAVTDEPGIYLVCAGPACELAPSHTPPIFNILYVGKADHSIRDRFKYHLGAGAKAPMRAARKVFGERLAFYFAATDEPVEVEKLIYDAFGPVVNSVSPPRGLTGHLGPTRHAGKATDDQ